MFWRRTTTRANGQVLTNSCMNCGGKIYNRSHTSFESYVPHTPPPADAWFHVTTSNVLCPPKKPLKFPFGYADLHEMRSACPSLNNHGTISKQELISLKLQALENQHAHDEKARLEQASREDVD